MKTKIYAIMSAAIAASVMLVSSCTKEGDAPVIGLDKESFAPTDAITGTITAEVGLKSVEIRKKAASGAYNSDNSIVYPDDRLSYSAGDYVYPEGASETKYRVNIVPGAPVTSLVVSVSNRHDAYNIPTVLPAGEYRLYAKDKNGVEEYVAFTIADPSATCTKSYTDVQLLQGILTGQGAALWNTSNAKDSIIAAGTYFFERQTSPKEYGKLEVTVLNGTSASLKLSKSNSATTTFDATNSGNAATIGTGTSESSYLTTEGVASMLTGGTLGTGAENLFCFIRSSESGLILTASHAGTGSGTSFTNAKNVKFISSEYVKSLALQVCQ